MTYRRKNNKHNKQQNEPPVTYETLQRNRCDLVYDNPGLVGMFMIFIHLRTLATFLFFTTHRFRKNDYSLKLRIVFLHYSVTWKNAHKNTVLYIYARIYLNEQNSKNILKEFFKFDLSCNGKLSVLYVIFKGYFLLIFSPCLT